MCSSELETDQILSSDHENNGIQDAITASCPICCCEILAGDESVSCPDCATLYHKDCWEENKGCAIYGCKSAHCLDVHAQENEQTYNQGPDQALCPWCYTLLSPKTVICPTCGKRTDTTTVQDYRQSDLFGTMKEKVFFPLLKSHVLLWKECCALWKKIAPLLLFVLKSYGKTISQYKVFDGTANRIEYFCFAIVSFVIYLLLFMLSGKYYLSLLYFLATACPTAAVMIRRLRDIGLSAWFLFSVPFLPFLLFCPSKPSSEDNNQNNKESSD